MLVLDNPAAHNFVRDQRRCGSDVRWDGWSMIFWKPSHHGYTHPQGAFRNGRWGMESRVEVGNDGFWRIPGKNVRKPL